MKSKQHQILIVDDNEADQFLCKMTIEALDTTIISHTAYDGKEALEVIGQRDQDIDLILVDINMPGMNGFGFLAAYQEKFSEHSAIIVMLSSTLQDDDRQKCLAYPQVKKFISKPLSTESLKECLLLLQDTPTYNQNNNQQISLSTASDTGLNTPR